MRNFSKLICIIIVIFLMLGLSACSPSKKELKVWNESKETVVYTTNIVDFTYETIDSAEDRTDFYVWYENTLGVETSSLINAEDFILYAHAFHERLQIKIEAEVGIKKGETVEVLKNLSIVEVEETN